MSLIRLRRGGAVARRLRDDRRCLVVDLGLEGLDAVAVRVAVAGGQVLAVEPGEVGLVVRRCLGGRRRGRPARHVGRPVGVEPDRAALDAAQLRVPHEEGVTAHRGVVARVDGEDRSRRLELPLRNRAAEGDQSLVGEGQLSVGGFAVLVPPGRAHEAHDHERSLQQPVVGFDGDALERVVHHAHRRRVEGEDDLDDPESQLPDLVDERVDGRLVLLGVLPAELLGEELLRDAPRFLAGDARIDAVVQDRGPCERAPAVIENGQVDDGHVVHLPGLVVNLGLLTRVLVDGFGPLDPDQAVDVLSPLAVQRLLHLAKARVRPVGALSRVVAGAAAQVRRLGREGRSEREELSAELAQFGRDQECLRVGDPLQEQRATNREVAVRCLEDLRQVVPCRCEHEVARAHDHERRYLNEEHDRDGDQTHELVPPEQLVERGELLQRAPADAPGAAVVARQLVLVHGADALVGRLPVVDRGLEESLALGVEGSELRAVRVADAVVLRLAELFGRLSSRPLTAAARRSPAAASLVLAVVARLDHADPRSAPLLLLGVAPDEFTPLAAAHGVARGLRVARVEASRGRRVLRVSRDRVARVVDGVPVSRRDGVHGDLADRRHVRRLAGLDVVLDLVLEERDVPAHRVEGHQDQQHHDAGVEAACGVAEHQMHEALEVLLAEEVGLHQRDAQRVAPHVPRAPRHVHHVDERAEDGDEDEPEEPAEVPRLVGEEQSATPPVQHHLEGGTRDDREGDGAQRSCRTRRQPVLTVRQHADGLGDSSQGGQAHGPLLFVGGVGVRPRIGHRARGGGCHRRCRRGRVDRRRH